MKAASVEFNTPDTRAAAKKPSPHEVAGSLVRLPERALEGTRILAVDDQVEARDLLAVVLRGYGAGVTVVSSGVEAIGMVAQVVPDLLISICRTRTDLTCSPG